MNSFATLSPDERKALFEVAADKVGIVPRIVEKDFWVCWVLLMLFELREVNEHLIFKGGTSLSKVYRIIERFSEDIDVSIARAYLGFGEENDPERMPSQKKKQKKIESLAVACSDYVSTTLKVNLQESIAKSLSSLKWDLVLDPSDSDKQTLLFHYPKCISDKNGAYIEQAIKIEMGARSDHWPFEMKTMHPLVSEYIPGAIKHPEINVRVLSAKRTFWEKATILHMYAYFPESKAIPKRQSRHYYDFYQMLSSPVKEEALDELDLLDRVAEHKSVYFRSGWANYHLAKKGTLKLIPADRVIKDMQRDYGAMEEMFFGAVPAWEDMIGAIRTFEGKFNHSS